MMVKTRRGPALIFLLLLTACGAGGGGDVVPSVTKTDPAPQSKNVPTTAPIRATFSYPVDPVSVNRDTFIVNGGTLIPGTVTYDNDTAIFTPSSPWAESTTYSVVLTTGVRDLDGIPLPSNFNWSFETAGPDTTAPTVAGTIPAEGATNVSRNTPIMVAFSEPVKPETVNSGTFVVSGGVKGSYEYDPATFTATFVPSVTLARDVEYQVTMTSGIQDLAGNGLEAKTWKFSTGASTDPVSPSPPTPPGGPPPPVPPGAPPLPTSPLVLFSYPCSGMDRIRTDLKEVAVKFNQAVPASKVDGPFALLRENDGAPVAGTFQYQEAERRAVFDPAGRLDFDTWYVAALDGIQSPSDGAVTRHHWRFKTAIDPKQIHTPDVTSPAVSCTDPPNGSTVPAPRYLGVYFNEPIDPKTVTSSTFRIQAVGSSSRDDRNDKPGDSLSWYRVDQNAALYVPPAFVNFNAGTTYKVTMTTGIKDLAGNRLASDHVWMFTAR